MKTTACAMAALVAVLAIHDAVAVETLSTRELASHCAHFPDKPDSPDGVFCVRYIQGFIDGAIATDERVMLNVAAEYDKDESFTERAMRTRLGGQVQRYGASYYAEFCLGAPVPLKEVVNNIVVDLVRTDADDRSPVAREEVYRILRAQYACARPTDK